MFVHVSVCPSVCRPVFTFVVVDTTIGMSGKIFYLLSTHYMQWTSKFVWRCPFMSAFNGAPRSLVPGDMNSGN